MIINPTEFWRNKRVLITGHTGFKGTWLCLWLKKLDAQVYGLSLASSDDQQSTFDLLKVGNDVISFAEDIRDRSAVLRVVAQVQPEIVIHMAAQPLVRRSYEDPVETIDVNVMGTVNILESLRLQPGCRVFLNVTTDKCYENREWDWGYRENEALGGHDPYSSSKACSEIVTAAYRSSFFNQQGSMAIATARAGNVIGGGDRSEDRLIPDVLNGLRADRTIVIRNPNATRPWQHVLDPLSGYLRLCQVLYDGHQFARSAWNFGPRDEGVVPVSNIVSFLTEKWPGGGNWIADDSDDVHEAQLLKLDISKSTSQLDWQPRMSLMRALNSIIEWEKSFLAGGDQRLLTLRQIEQFEVIAD
ncbi:CDP-glucose 4,6-dehydratase [Luminiphilus sp.]|nr:CDP-glucose 4,6-dehydratase [Luminiphilus sp.]